jgi:hypothetical protein
MAARVADVHERSRRRRSVLLGVSAAAAGAAFAIVLNRVSCLAETPVVALSQQAKSTAKPTPIDPGSSYNGPFAPLDDHEAAVAKALKGDVEKLAGDIAERSMSRYAKLVEAAALIEKSLQADGFQVSRQAYEVKGRTAANLEVEVGGTKTPAEIVIVGAHYDSAAGAPGADDNGSGVAALLALARGFAGKQIGRTLRLVAFANEEPPHFQEPSMGSLNYARRLKERKENIVAMLSLETIGYYSDKPDSQHYPPPLGLLYPSTGNFIAFVANPESDALVREATASFRKHAKFPSQWGVAPAMMPGIGWSDHWSFWQQGYQAIMITDTALFRYPHYHLKSDTPDKLDYARMARVVAGLEQVVADLVAAH